MSQDEYYLIKKSDVDLLKNSYGNNLDDYDGGKWAALSMIGVELGKLIDLSKHEILNKAEFHIEKEGVETNIDSFFDGYVASLMDLKK